ncbi:TetR family transcriptional regulator [Actinoplanes sp. NPDC023936]|uniref:TetR/AcrR family transcriptional regulator n=1 Tax=Actinoplanes sp. NPDC023936 TaxID=3154910 RepID=UPI0033BFE246
MTVLDDILEAALKEFSEVGIRRTSIDDVARRVGLARATAYRHVGTKNHLIELVIEAETRRGVEALDDVLGQEQDPARAIEAGFVFLVRYVRGHPLFDRVLHREPELLLPALTINAGPVLAVYRSLIAERLRDWRDRGRIAPADVDRAAEAIVRFAVSLLLTPHGVAEADDPGAVAAFARETLLPMLRPAPGQGS